MLVANVWEKPTVILSVSQMSTAALQLSADSGCGKRKAHKKWSMVIPEKVATVTVLDLP